MKLNLESPEIKFRFHVLENNAQIYQEQVKPTQYCHWAVLSLIWHDSQNLKKLDNLLMFLALIPPQGGCILKFLRAARAREVCSLDLQTEKVDDNNISQITWAQGQTLPQSYVVAWKLL